jgi:hypothetical protein
MTTRKQIGFSQRVRLEWLEYAANLVRVGHGPRDVEDALQKLLSGQLSIGGTAKRGNREKAITIILKTWSSVSQSLTPLRDDALRLLETLPPEEHIVLHWGMCSAAYPFWAAVGDVTGRLLRLQHEAAASQIQRRVKEQYGERETVARATRRVIRAFADWEVVNESDKKGIYLSGKTISSNNAELALWIVEAMLHASPSGSLSVESLRQLPSVFPFKLQWPRVNAIDASPRLQVFRQGMAEDIIELRTRH